MKKRGGEYSRNSRHKTRCHQGIGNHPRGLFYTTQHEAIHMHDRDTEKLTGSQHQSSRSLGSRPRRCRLKSISHLHTHRVCIGKLGTQCLRKAPVDIQTIAWIGQQREPYTMPPTNRTNRRRTHSDTSSLCLRHFREYVVTKRGQSKTSDNLKTKAILCTFQC